jgi:transcriptional regulator with XRE-family HTH domain
MALISPNITICQLYFIRLFILCWKEIFMVPNNLISLPVGKRIRHARKAQKLTQQELAKQLGISTVTLNRYEKGHRSPDTDILGRLVSILKCDAQWVVTGEEIIPAGHKPAVVIRSSDQEECLSDSTQDPLLSNIVLLLKNELPEAKEHILKILIGRKQMKDGLNALGHAGS